MQTVFVLWIWFATVGQPPSQWAAVDSFTSLAECKIHAGNYERVFKEMPNSIGGAKCLPAGTSPK